MRKLDSTKIKYETLTYTIDKDSFSAEAVSDLIGIEYERLKLVKLFSKNNKVLVISRTKKEDVKRSFGN